MTSINYYAEKIKNAVLPKKRDKEKIQITPYRDWKIIVMIFVFTVAILSGATFYVSYSLNENVSSDSAQNGLLPVETIDRNSMLKTIEIFDGREARLADLLSKKPRKIDPSL